MKNSLITAATSGLYAVTLAEARTACRIDSHEEDTFLASLLKASQEAAEDFMWQKLFTQTWDQYFDAFDDPLRLQYNPVQSITSVTYVDSDGDTQTLSTDVYELGYEDDLGIVRRKYNQQWPTVRGHEDVVIVRHVLGYGDADSDVPERVKQAMRLHVAHHYTYRDGTPVPDAFWNLLRVESARRHK